MQDNYKLLTTPNCKNRDFNAGVQYVIDRIKEVIKDNEELHQIPLQS